MTYQELEDQVNQLAEDVAALQEAVNEADLVGGIGGLSFPLDPNVQLVLDQETLTYLQGRTGTATLVAGTVTVSNPLVSANSIIIISRKTSGGTLGYLYISAQSSGSFTITSSSNTDTSTVNYLII
jgi:hypothetical protein